MERTPFGGVVGMVIMGLVGCGTEPAETLIPDQYQQETIDDCTECDVPVEEVGFFKPPTPTISVYPAELMFYGDLSSQESLGPQVVTIDNSTMSTTLVSRAYIVDQEDMGTGTGAAEFFHIERADLDVPLYPHDEMELVVSFDRSSEQRDALLVIETTNPNYGSLVVELSGKYFLW